MYISLTSSLKMLLYSWLLYPRIKERAISRLYSFLNLSMMCTVYITFQKDLLGLILPYLFLMTSTNSVMKLVLPEVQRLENIVSRILLRRLLGSLGSENSFIFGVFFLICLEYSNYLFFDFLFLKPTYRFSSAGEFLLMRISIICSHSLFSLCMKELRCFSFIFLLFLGINSTYSSFSSCRFYSLFSILIFYFSSLTSLMKFEQYFNSSMLVILFFFDLFTKDENLLNSFPLFIYNIKCEFLIFIVFSFIFSKFTSKFSFSTLKLCLASTRLSTLFYPKSVKLI